MNSLLLLALTSLAAPAAAQTAAPADSTFQPAATPDSAAARPLRCYGFADGYYGHDFTGPARRRPDFLYSHARAGQPALNNALLGLRYETQRVRGVLALHAGRYVRANYAAEPRRLRHLYEAYAGFRPLRRAWLDVGIFASHLGFESALSKDNWTLTRAVMTENAPYYQAGARLTYEASPKLTLTGLVLNGWQNLRDNNRAKALGTQVQWKPSARLLLSSSTFYGNEQPRDSARRRRFFHDFYLTYAATEKLSLAAVLDAGWQPAPSRPTDTWQAAMLLARYRLRPRWTAAARYELYRADHGVVIRSLAPRPTDANFRLGGASLNLDYAPSTHVLLRVEGRVLRSRNQPFTADHAQPTARYANLTSSVAVSF